MENKKPCPECRADGVVDSPDKTEVEVCGRCHGTGRVKEETHATKQSA